MPSNCVGETTTDPKGNVSTKVYDRAGRLYQIKVGDDTTTYEYFDNGNLQKLTYPNGLTAEYTYYADNRLHTLANKNGLTITSAYNYDYDANGNRVTVLDSDGTTTYAYDELNRLESVTEPSGKVTAYTFDASGNRTTETVTESSAVATSYTYNVQNQLSSTAKTSGGTVVDVNYAYDNNGNELSESTSGAAAATYSYNALNQMISAQTAGSTATYTYNGDGLRASKAVTEGGATETTKYLYEYDKPVLELDGSGNETAYSVYGGNTLISRTVDGETLYYLYNGHGDVIQLTDANGSVAMTYKYDAFGNVTTATGTQATPYRYSGYQFDEETGLYYLNARYYNPVVARFVSADTYYGQASDPLSLNLYTYCHNEPMMYWDPTGHDDIDLNSLLASMTALTASINELTATVNDLTNSLIDSGLAACAELANADFSAINALSNMDLSAIDALSDMDLNVDIDLGVISDPNWLGDIHETYLDICSMSNGLSAMNNNFDRLNSNLKATNDMLTPVGAAGESAKASAGSFNMTAYNAYLQPVPQQHFTTEGNRTYLDKVNIAKGEFGIASWDVNAYSMTGEISKRGVVGREDNWNGTKAEGGTNKQIYGIDLGGSIEGSVGLIQGKGQIGDNNLGAFIVGEVNVDTAEAYGAFTARVDGETSIGFRAGAEAAAVTGEAGLGINIGGYSIVVGSDVSYLGAGAKAEFGYVDGSLKGRAKLTTGLGKGFWFDISKIEEEEEEEEK